jgi:hypothetical protein
MSDFKQDCRDSDYNPIVDDLGITTNAMREITDHIGFDHGKMSEQDVYESQAFYYAEHLWCFDDKHLLEEAFYLYIDAAGPRVRHDFPIALYVLKIRGLLDEFAEGANFSTDYFEKQIPAFCADFEGDLRELTSENGNV